MTIQEFETMTKFHPSHEMFECISEEYMNYDGDKQSFCKAYVKDENGLASKIQRLCTAKAVKAEETNKAKLIAKDNEIEALKVEIEKLKRHTLSDAILQQIGQHFTQESNDLCDSVQMMNEQILEFCEEPDGAEFKTAVESRKRMNDKIREYSVFVDVIAKARGNK